MKVLYYLIIFPLSKLPSRVLYVIGHFIYFVLYQVIGYRKQVVRTNLKNSFPKKTSSELKKIEKDYYSYLSQLFVEFIKNLGISKGELLKRIKVINPEVLDQLFDEGKSVILAGAHYNNWEYLITAQDLLFKHQAAGIGLPLSNSFWDKKVNQRRARFGMRVTHAGNIKEKLTQWKNEKIALLVLFDQSPPDSNRSFWTNFLHQQTAFLFGTEKLAVQYNFPVVQFFMHQPKKGHYEIQLSLISDCPREEEYGKITNQLISNLENQIKEEPVYWLWSHKRWKREVPNDLEQLKLQQKEKHSIWKANL